MTARCDDSRRQPAAALREQKNARRTFSARIFQNFFAGILPCGRVAARIAGARRAAAPRQRAIFLRIEKMPVFSSDSASSEISNAGRRAARTARDGRRVAPCRAAPRARHRVFPAENARIYLQNPRKCLL